MHYKILSDNTVIDAVKHPCFVWYDKRLGLFRACKEDKAQGIAAHDGSTYWHISGRPDFGIDGYRSVELEEADEADVSTIIEALNTGKHIAIEEPEPERAPAPSLPEGGVEIVKDYLLNLMGEKCSQNISDGFDVELDKSYHVTLSPEDKANLAFAYQAAQNYSDNIPVHVGNIHGFFSAADVMKLMNCALEWEQYQTAQYQSLCDHIRSLRSIKSLSAVSYEMDVPDKHRHILLDKLDKYKLRGEKHDPR